MSSLVETLYPLPDLRRTPLSTLRWWESRRLQYNLIVGSAGLLTLSAFTLASIVLPWVNFGPPGGLLVGAAIYAVLANGCYTLGWLIEMAARAVWGPQAPRMGPLLYREGLIFSVGLTLLPILVLTLTTLMRIVGFVVR
jgi:hypothetical protein